MAKRAQMSDAGQGGVIVVVISLGLVAILTVVLLGTMSNSGSKNGLQGNPGVGAADDIQAKANLSQAITGARTVEESGGSVSATSLSSSDPSVQYTSGPSTSSGVISVAAGPAGGAGAPSGTPGVPDISVPGASGSPASPAGGGSGAVLAVYSSSGTCWVAYLGGSTLWYGAQTDQTGCTAPTLGTAPTASAVSSTAIGWQQGSFPPA